jgi:hypothetical protein
LGRILEYTGFWVECTGSWGECWSKDPGVNARILGRILEYTVNAGVYRRILEWKGVRLESNVLMSDHRKW